MGEPTRTAAQIEADRIDSDMVRLSNRIQAFGEDHLRGSAAASVDEVSRKIFGMRSTIRQHMSKHDQESTQ